MMEITYTKKDFEIFKKECRRWIEKLGLGGWQVTFAFQQIREGDSYATIDTDFDGMVANITLTKVAKLSAIDDKGFRDDIRRHAKHEVMHLLLSKLSALAGRRYCAYTDINSAEEEIVNLLIKKLK